MTLSINFVYFLIFVFKSGIDAQIAECEFNENSAGLYGCNLSTIKSNYNANLSRVDGQHETGHDDDDVKWIENYKDHKVKTISSIFCQKFPNLEVLAFNGAELESIDVDSLENCENLGTLSLFGNKIRELLEKVFVNQKELKKLTLDYNEIHFLHSEIFHPLVKLDWLFLNHNKLQSIIPEWFVNLQSLKWFSVNTNKISTIPPNCFASLTNLEHLYLQENRIEDLNSNSFSNLEFLKELNLAGNKISDLPVNIFTPLLSLEVLKLSNNRLTAIHSHSFDFHKRLKKFYLQDNAIDKIDEKIVNNIPISTLDMRNNICSQSNFEDASKSEIRSGLGKCFDNYKPRPRHLTDFNKIEESVTPNLSFSCGKALTGHGTIIGEAVIHRGDFPWIAALIAPNGQFFCGGTLISNRKVITAAHCIHEKKLYTELLARDMVVLLGIHDLNNHFEPERTIKSLQSINMHPDWNPFTESYDADIAVLVFASEVIFSNSIQPICMFGSLANAAEYTSGVVVGYGRSEDDSKIHENIPKILEMPIHDNVDCFLKNNLLATLSSRRTFCGGSGKGTGVCVGDSGSGLIVTDGTAYYLRGIVSSSLFNARQECDVDNYSVFTDISTYTDWINGIPITRFK